MKTLWKQFETNLKAIWKQFKANLKSIWKHFGTNLNAIWTQFESNLKTIFNQFESNLKTIWRQFESPMCGNHFPRATRCVGTGYPVQPKPTLFLNCRNPSNAAWWGIKKPNENLLCSHLFFAFLSHPIQNQWKLPKTNEN